MRLRKLLFSVILLPFLGLVSCAEEESEKPVGKGAYFDVPGFMQEQLTVLKQQQPALQKTVWVNQEKPETKQLQSVNWEEELQHFLEIDLNKKALAGTYEVEEESKSEGKRIVYNRKADVNTPVKTLEILTDNNNVVKHLRAVSEEQNALFYSQEERLLTIGGNNTIKSFRVSGVQKVLLFDTLHYAAKASVHGTQK